LILIVKGCVVVAGLQAVCQRAALVGCLLVLHLKLVHLFLLRSWSLKLLAVVLQTIRHEVTDELISLNWKLEVFLGSLSLPVVDCRELSLWLLLI